MFDHTKSGFHKGKRPLKNVHFRSLLLSVRIQVEDPGL